MITDEWQRLDKWSVLQVLFGRVISGRSDASLSYTGISRELSRGLPPALIEIYCDELMDDDYISSATGGVRERVRITSMGIRAVDARNDEEAEKVRGNIASEDWTGHYDFVISDNRKEQVVAKIVQLKKIIEEAPLSNEERSQAMSLAASALLLAEAPQPAWTLIKELLILVAAVATCLGFAATIGQMIS